MAVRFGPEEDEPVARATPADYEEERVAAAPRTGTQGPHLRQGSDERLRARARAATAIATDFLPETQDVLYEEVAANTLVAASRWPIPLADVSATIQRYVTQEQLLARYGLPIPSIPVGGGAPPLPAAVLPAAAMASPPSARGESDLIVIQREREQLDLSLKRAGLSTVDLAPSAARSAVRERLAQFLQTRLVAEEQRGLLRRLTGAIRGRPPAGRPDSPGLPFKVTTHAAGMRIHWSPAYFFESEHVFGFGLSTPVDGWLQPGRYIFGAMGPQGMTWEHDAEYRLPDARVASLMSV